MLQSGGWRTGLHRLQSGFYAGQHQHNQCQNSRDSSFRAVDTGVSSEPYSTTIHPANTRRDTQDLSSTVRLKAKENERAIAETVRATVSDLEELPAPPPEKKIEFSLVPKMKIAMHHPLSPLASAAANMCLVSSSEMARIYWRPRHRHATTAHNAAEEDGNAKTAERGKWCENASESRSCDKRPALRIPPCRIAVIAGG